MKPRVLLDAATTLVLRCPEAELVKAPHSGNLAIVQDGMYVGFVDLYDGEVQIFARPQPLEPLS